MKNLLIMNFGEENIFVQRLIKLSEYLFKGIFYNKNEAKQK